MQRESTTHIEPIPRGAPAFAESQRDEILQLLREAGPLGVDRDFLIFTKHYTQCGARIFELRKMGYGVRSEQREGRRFVKYVLESEPLEPKPLPKSADWYEANRGSRPTAKPKATATELSLFAGAEHV